jgi:hypothetical protein
MAAYSRSDGGVMSKLEERVDASIESSLAEDLLDLYDEVAGFNDCCAFICDAFCSLAAEEEALETSTIEGLKCMSYWIKQRIGKIKEDIKSTLEKVPTQH